MTDLDLPPDADEPLGETTARRTGYALGAVMATTLLGVTSSDVLLVAIVAASIVAATILRLRRRAADLASDDA